MYVHIGIDRVKSCLRKWIEFIILYQLIDNVRYKWQETGSILGYDQFSWRKHLNDPLMTINYSIEVAKCMCVSTAHEFVYFQFEEQIQGIEEFPGERDSVIIFSIRLIANWNRNSSEMEKSLNEDEISFERTQINFNSQVLFCCAADWDIISISLRSNVTALTCFGVFFFSCFCIN